MSGMNVTNTQGVQYTSATTGVAQNTPTNAPQASNTSEYKYPYGDDVFTGQFQTFKKLYVNFEPKTSQFSPFYGRTQEPSTQSQVQTQGAGQTQGNSGIPASLLNGVSPTVASVPATLPTGNNQQVQTQQQSAPPVSTAPKKNPLAGPVMTNIQDVLRQEAQQITTPQKAMEVIASHAMLSRQERTMTNDVAWGARFYAKQASEQTDKLMKNKANMSPAQVQSQARNIESLKIKSVSLLNDAKKKAISTYNEALKATLLYNNFFTEKGAFATAMSPTDRQFVESELDKTWKNWQGGFEKEWNGQMAHADEAPAIVDSAAREVAIEIDKVDKMLATLVKQ